MRKNKKVYAKYANVLDISVYVYFYFLMIFECPLFL